MSLRTDLRDLLTAALPETWDVRADALDVDSPEAGRPVVLIETTGMTPGPTLGLRTVEANLHVVTPVTDPEQVDDELDDLLSVLLPVIEAASPLAWTDAKRGLLDGRLHAYTVTVTAPTRRKA